MSRKDGIGYSSMYLYICSNIYFYISNHPKL